jgi:hypothetical protein
VRNASYAKGDKETWFVVAVTTGALILGFPFSNRRVLIRVTWEAYERGKSVFIGAGEITDKDRVHWHRRCLASHCAVNIPEYQNTKKTPGL